MNRNKARTKTTPVPATSSGRAARISHRPTRSWTIWLPALRSRVRDFSSSKAAHVGVSLPAGVVAIWRHSAPLGVLALLYLFISLLRHPTSPLPSVEASRSIVSVVLFTVSTKHATYPGLAVEVVDPRNSQQLEAGARAALAAKGLDGDDLTAYRAYGDDGQPLGPTVTV